MRLRIVRPLPPHLEGVDLANYRFGASYDISAPLCDVLLVGGFGVPLVDDPATDAATLKPPEKKARKPHR